MGPLRAVTFDAWQTLLHDRPEVTPGQRTALRVESLWRVLDAAGYAISREALETAYEALGPHCAEVWQSVEFDHEAQLRWLLERATGGSGIALSYDTWQAVEAAYVDPIHESPPELAPHAPAAIQAIRKRRLRVGLICNTGYTPGYAIRRLFARWEILDLFDDLAFSNEEGIRKPESELFHRVAGRLATEPSQIAHVGDDLITDVAGAKRAGYRAVLIRPIKPPDVPVEPDAHISDLAELDRVIANWAEAPSRRDERTTLA